MTELTILELCEPVDIIEIHEPNELDTELFLTGVLTDSSHSVLKNFSIGYKTFYKRCKSMLRDIIENSVKMGHLVFTKNIENEKVLKSINDNLYDIYCENEMCDTPINSYYLPIVYRQLVSTAFHPYGKAGLMSKEYITI